MNPFAFVGPSGLGKDATPGEQLAAGITHLLFPTVLFCLILFTDLGSHETLVLVLVPVLSLVGYLLTRMFSGRVSMALLVCFGGLLWNLVAAAAGMLLAGLLGFYETF
jgi:hypothetical protein